MFPLLASITVTPSATPPPCTPLPDTVWAGSVVAYAAGPGVEPAWGDPGTALGAPDFDEGTGAVSLGNREEKLGNREEKPAELIVAFAGPAAGGPSVVRGAVLVDGPGDDLTVFEAGPSVEPTELSVSSDGETWYLVGTIRGASRAVDLAGKVPAGGTFSLVRLRTASTSPSRGPWAGPDIDAVGLLHACRAGAPDT